MPEWLETARQVVAKASRGKQAQAEAYLIYSRDLTIEVANQKVQNLSMAEDRGIGLRLIIDGRLGYAYSSDLTAPALDKLVEMAVANAAPITPDPYNLLPLPASQYPQLELHDPAIARASVEEKIDLARQIEEVGRSLDPRVKITERAAYEDAEYEVTIVSSTGINAAYQGSYCGIYAFFVATEGGDSQNGFSLNYARKYQDLNPQRVGEEAARRAVRMLGAKTMPTRKLTVIMEPYIATSFLGVLAPALTAEAVQKGRSLFAGKVGQAVASAKVNIIDDGVMPGRIGSAPFDGEGVPSTRTNLITAGNLQGFLHNNYTAAKEGVTSTGNGVRGSYKGTPSVGTTNFFLAPGDLSPEQLIAEVDEGFYLTDVMGMHTANPISGDFSVGAAGLLIEKGQLTRAVRGVAVAGNLLELLQAVEAVGNDLTFFGGKGSPTLRITGITVSGS